MLRITVNLLPFGFESHQKNLATIEITNNGTGSHSSGSYNYSISDRTGRVYRRGEVSGFPRMQKTAVELLRLILNDSESRKKRK